MTMTWCERNFSQFGDSKLKGYSHLWNYELSNEWMMGWDGYSSMSWGGVSIEISYPIIVTNVMNVKYSMGNNAKHRVDMDWEGWF